jgi:hypothetical protein
MLGARVDRGADVLDVRQETGAEHQAVFRALRTGTEVTAGSAGVPSV